MFSVDLPNNLTRKIKAIEDLTNNMPDIRDDVARNAAFYYRRKIKEHIDAQDLNWEPLNPDYKKRKQEQGYDTRIWIARGILRRHIKVARRGPADYVVTIPPEAEYPEGINIRKVFFANEYGRLDGSIPARPLFRPTKKEVRKRLIREVKKSNQRIIQALTKDHNLNNVKAITPDWSGD